ncbi:MAG: MoaD/ThiS family protein [Actinomycetota bacterium]|nr:MoaD/ThiS family protein [Actinomycetota bacterium]
MPVRVHLPTVLRPLTGGEPVVTAHGDNLEEVFSDLEGRYPGLAEQLVDGRGGLQRYVNVFLGDEDVRYLDGLQTRVPDGAEISILPAVAGG